MRAFPMGLLATFVVAIGAGGVGAASAGAATTIGSDDVSENTGAFVDCDPDCPNDKVHGQRPGLTDHGLRRTHVGLALLGLRWHHLHLA
jgi:hypothetical protein